MRRSRFALASVALLTTLAATAVAQDAAAAQSGAPRDTTPDPVRTMVARLDLEKYKATIKGLTQFGDRRQGTDRNRAAIDWIEAQLKSYGCTNTERIKYEYNGRQLRNDSTNKVDSARAAANPNANAGRGGAGGRGGAAAGRGGGGRGQNPVKGFRGPTGVNTNPDLQPDTALRRINAQRDTPGPREEVYCTKIGDTKPGEMYIIGAHMDGHGFGSAANDDGSGTALVMELARIFHSPDVKTDRSIRFILFNNEETGGGAAAYVRQRAPLQGIEQPAGSGKYPEPKWLGMIQHDMMMWDHGMPGPDGKVSSEQRREADVNIEFAGSSKFASEAAQLAWFFRQSNDRYATDYPAAVGDRMSNTDSGSFQDVCPAISLRENERLAHTGTGWNPTWHQPIDVFSTFSDKDFKLGLNAAQTTLSAVAQLAGAKLSK
ncbi:MAG TPA: M20/M25/M40 family metallo-hydrolase [Gemmatimonadaceae bacterium]